MSEQPRIASIRLNGMFGHQQLMADLQPGLNLLHGKNGTGKTTLLHVLANLLEGDLYRFFGIRFRRLIFRLYDGTEIVLEQMHDSRESDPVEIRVRLRGKDLGTLSPITPVPELIASSIREIFPSRPVYLPAFRSILEAADEREQFNVFRESASTQAEFEAIKANEERYIRDRRQRGSARIPEKADATAAKTMLSRRWFGEFVPIIRYPSVADVSRQLREEFDQAYFNVNRKNQETFASVFTTVLQILEKRMEYADEETRGLIKRVQKHLKELEAKDTRKLERPNDAAQLFEMEESVPGEQDSIRAILKLYDSALVSRASREEEAFKGLRLLEDSFNRFITPKALRLVGSGFRGGRSPAVSYPNGHQIKLGVLSSGERQVLTMLFCATHMSPADGTMLIDEPEISLHVDWQRIILDEIMRQAGDRQVIVCTHAPEVVAEHRKALVELASSAWSLDGKFAGDPDIDTETTARD